MDPAIRELTDALRRARGRPIVIVTGAGISAASGISTFRGSDPDAVWNQYDIEMATFGFFERDPVAQWRWYLERFRRALAAEPNPAHHALVALEGWAEGRFDLVTQNIDTLHERAGSQALIKVHGSADRVRCSRAGCSLGEPIGSLPRHEKDFAPFLAEPRRDNLPTCPECGSLLRAHVLFFDEYYTAHRDYRYREVADAAERAELLIFIGTSMAVGVTEMFLQAAARRGVPAYSLDPAAERVPRGVRPLAAKAEELLPAVAVELASSRID
ncbi:MAG: Sir2 family NAD-dependent protein deacetylase [Acidobacteriota bacterium]